MFTVSKRKASRNMEFTTEGGRFSVCRKPLVIILLITILGNFTFPLHGSKNLHDLSSEEGLRKGEMKFNVNQAIYAEESGNQYSTYLLTTNNAGSCYIAVQCRIICSWIPSDSGKEAAAFINSNFMVQCSLVQPVMLIFENSKFPVNRLQRDWLKTNATIKELVFNNCFLTEITDEAFSREIYRETKSISFIKNNISTFNKAIFRYFHALQQLTVRENILEKVEFNLLESVASTLEILELSRAIENTEVLVNITGGNLLPKVQILSISDNSIPVINREIFLGIPNVQSLYIERSQVSSILLDAFQTEISKSLRQLFIDYNNIKSLPEGIFDPILKNKQEFHISAYCNPWHCNCDMKWIQEVVINYPKLFNSMPVCSTPENNACFSFTAANFCSENTDSLNATANALIANNAHFMNCRTDCASIDNPKTNKSAVSVNCETFCTFLQERIRLRTFFARLQFLDFFATEYENKTILVHLPTLKVDTFLVWFKNDILDSTASKSEQAKVHCEENIKSVFILENVEPQTTYWICFLDDPLNNSFPLNCLSLTTRPLYSDTIWLRKEDKVIVLSVYVILLCVFCVISGLLTFIVIRRYPNLLCGSNRIMMVKHKKLDAIILPRGISVKNKQKKYTLSTSENSKEDGYVTPLPPIRRFIRRDSRLSEISLQSDGSSYVSGIVPTLPQLTSWRSEAFNRTKSGECDPPPLPPYHKYEIIPSLSLTVDVQSSETSAKI